MLIFFSLKIMMTILFFSKRTESHVYIIPAKTLSPVLLNG